MSHAKKWLGLGISLLALAALVPIAAAQGMPTVQIAQNPTLGNILTDSNGMTLYLFTPDQANMSTYYDKCATAWPPLVVAQGDPVAGAGLTAQLGVASRKDGSMQVTYNGMPLCYWFKDKQPGDVNGQGVLDTWFVVHPDIASMAINSPVVQLTKNATLGDILTNQGMTLYRLEKDQPNVSTCLGPCATNWPPLLIAGGEPQAGKGVTGTLGVITRTDGSKQVTYNGDPLYFFAKDVRPGDINGEDVGGVWYGVTLTGESAEPPASPAPAATPASSSSGW